jgi:hypothetical protein
MQIGALYEWRVIRPKQEDRLNAGQSPATLILKRRFVGGSVSSKPTTKAMIPGKSWKVIGANRLDARPRPALP